MNTKDSNTEKRKYPIQTMMLLFVIGGVFGFVYEEIFYRIDLGHWVKRGTTFGPWIPIYAIGAVVIILLIDKIKEKPLWVFGASVIVSGIIEFVAGYGLFHFFHLRLWDYNVEIWNWGNVGGYVCLRSVLFFGFAALLFQYGVMNSLIKFTENCPKKKLSIIAGVPAAIFVLDIIVSLTIRALH